MPDSKDITGGCYCGKVRYAARNAATALIECHCRQCRKQSGHRYATTAIVAGDFVLEGEDEEDGARQQHAHRHGHIVGVVGLPVQDHQLAGALVVERADHLDRVGVEIEDGMGVRRDRGPYWPAGMGRRERRRIRPAGRLGRIAVQGAPRIVQVAQGMTHPR